MSRRLWLDLRSSAILLANKWLYTNRHKEFLDFAEERSIAFLTNVTIFFKTQKTNDFCLFRFILKHLNTWLAFYVWILHSEWRFIAKNRNQLNESLLKIIVFEKVIARKCWRLNFIFSTTWFLSILLYNVNIINAI